jgi:hypothetical protein
MITRIPSVFQTPKNTRYLKDPGVVFLAKTICIDPRTSGLHEFMTELDPAFEHGYDDFTYRDDQEPAGGAELVQFKSFQMAMWDIYDRTNWN